MRKIAIAAACLAAALSLGACSTVNSWVNKANREVVHIDRTIAKKSPQLFAYCSRANAALGSANAFGLADLSKLQSAAQAACAQPPSDIASAIKDLEAALAAASA